ELPRRRDRGVELDAAPLRKVMARRCAARGDVVEPRGSVVLVEVSGPVEVVRNSVDEVLPLDAAHALRADVEGALVETEHHLRRDVLVRLPRPLNRRALTALIPAALRVGSRAVRARRAVVLVLDRRRIGEDLRVDTVRIDGYERDPSEEVVSLE